MPRFEERGVTGTLIAGSAFGAQAGVSVQSPMFYTPWTLHAGALAALPAEYPERAAYVATGEVEIDGQVLGGGKMAVFLPGNTVTVRALRPSTVMLIGGEPVGERFLEWNFVSSSRERIEQAKADWRAGRMALPQLDHDEFIPLPDSAPPPPERVS